MTPHTPMCVPFDLHPTFAILCRNREVGVSRGRTGLCGMAPLMCTRLGTSPGPQPRAAEQGCRHCCHHLPAETIPSTPTSHHRLCIPLPLTYEESREGFMGAVRAPSSP